MSDIGPNSNRRQVARAVSDLQDQVADFDVSVLDGRVDAAEADIDALQTELAIVAGPQTLEATFLTKVVLRKVLSVAAGPNSSTVNTAHGISSPVAIIGCIIQLTNGTNHLCFNQGGMLSDTIAHSIIVSIDGTNVGMTSGAGGDYHLYAGKIILLYTLT